MRRQDIMLIDNDKCQDGNRAMAMVLLLYYHMIREGGFTNDQTVYLGEAFDGFSCLNARVIEREMDLEIDANLIREGAVICLLCDLNDMVGEFERNYLAQDRTHKILKALSQREPGLVPEVDEVVALLTEGEEGLNWAIYRQSLAGIYDTYVLGRFRSIGR